ncbi:MAG: radical SAM protein [Candidatus Moranbacteria bacterium]|nr:radical SAM protein [Candidatus Moranbacteria bacterium]
MKVALIRTAIVPDKERHLAYGSNISPMATSVALLGACLREKFPEVKISILNENWPPEKIAKRAAKFDLVGFSTTYATHGPSCEIARKINQLNPEVGIIFGGIDAANKGSLILKSHFYINYVCGNQDNPWGENVITTLALSAPENVSNIWLRKHGKVIFTDYNYDLGNLPLWDFGQFKEHDERIQPYLKPAGDWDLPHHSVFSWRGCLKSLRRGRCAFCTSAVDSPNFMPPENFWRQILHLQENEFPGVKMNLYLGDNHTPPGWVRKLAEKMPAGINARFRAYGWLPEIISLNPAQLKGFAQDLHAMGFYNLFYGVESFDREVLSSTNKDFVSVPEMARVITSLFNQGGVRATIAIIVGLPGENEESLKTTLASFRELFALVPNGAIERVYLSHLVVLHGSAIMENMKRNLSLCVDYERLTGKVFATDDDPPVDLLTALHLKYFTGITPAIANVYHDRIVDVSLESGIPRQQIGGFEERHIIDNIFSQL